MTIRFKGRVVGMIHFAQGISGVSVVERFEAMGEDSNVIIDNGIKFSYYRPSRGRVQPSYFLEDLTSSACWEPESTYRTYYNKNPMLLGYWGEVYYFAKCVLENIRPKINGLEDALEYLRFFEAFRQGEKKIIQIN